MPDPDEKSRTDVANALSLAIANLGCRCTDDDACDAHQLLDQLAPDPADADAGPGADQDEVVAAPEVKRINVAVNGEMVEAIERVIETEKVSLTEAVRRLVMIGDKTYELLVIDQNKLYAVSPAEHVREVILLVTGT